jgi:hypothetical protein
MGSALRQFILFVCFMALGSSAAAQGRVPATDSGAIGGDVGIMVPRAEPLGTGPVLEGFYEYYFAPRTSVRIGLGWANPSFDREEDDSLRTLRVPVDLVYNWEGGTLHPFAGAGLGIYFVQQKDNGASVGDSATKVGATLLGGVEFFSGRSVAVKGEARYHLLGDAFGINPGGLAVTIGVKKYF